MLWLTVVSAPAFAQESAQESAEETLACRNSLGIDLNDEAPTPRELDDPNTIQLEAGGIDASIGEPRSASMTGGIVLRRGDKLAGADAARFDFPNRALYLDGSVRYQDPATQIISQSAEFAYDSGRVRFTGAEFSLDSDNSRGAAADLLIQQDGNLTLDDVEYTTCPPGSNDYLLKAGNIRIDSRKGIATARNVRLRFQGVPILYTPYISFPVGDARKSGILTPVIGSAGRSGNEIRVPYYWNIAPNYDATLTPRLLTDRGFQLQSEFRYLTDSHSGVVVADYLGDDTITDDSRYLFSLENRSELGDRWRAEIGFMEVSDNQYFEDLGGSLSQASITHLDRKLRFERHGEHVSLFGQFQDFQTLDDAIGPANEPYRRVPQLAIRGRWPELVRGTELGLTGELVNFDRDVGVTGWRLNLAPEIALPLKRPGWFVVPSVALDHTSYALNDTLPEQATDPSRTLPISSIDTGMVFERVIERANRSRLATIEPRLLYVHIPFREQSDLPVFDTITPDVNLVQLFRKNRFLGVDRIADTDQLSLGITSRILDLGTGRELVTASLGQTRYLSSSGVTLPDEPELTNDSSDYIAEVRFLLFEHLNFDFGHQWGTGDRGTTQSEARLQYRPSDNKVLNLGYRFRRDSIEQGDVSMSWPIARRWNFVGRYNYSFREREALEQFFGLEYESCCWGLRLVSRRFISTRDGTRDSSFSLQLVLKGMASVGSPTDKLLERGILGYSARLQ